LFETIGDPIGHIALSNAVERDRHAFSSKANFPPIDLHALPIDQGKGRLNVPPLIIATGIGVPKWLHSDIEGAITDPRQPSRDVQEFDQLGRGTIQMAIPVQSGDR